MALNKYKFTIIMAIYGVEHYIDEAIQSVINQTIGFEENIQLILVNDDSPDSSGKIAQNYQERYPNNIVYLEETNSGQAAARNYGMTFANGEFLNFLDPDDWITSNTLSDIWNAYEAHRNLKIFGIPMRMFEAVNRDHPLNKYRTETGIVDIEEHPEATVNHSGTSFFHYSLFGPNDVFNTDLVVGEDAFLVNDLVLKAGKYYIVGTGKYMYRKRSAGDSTLNSVEENPLRYHSQITKQMIIPIKTKYIDDSGSIHPWLQNAYLYELGWQFKKKERPKPLNSPELWHEYVNDLIIVLSYIDDKVIEKSEWLNYEQINGILYLKHNHQFPNWNRLNTPREIDGNVVFDKDSHTRLYGLTADIRGIFVRNDELYINGVIRSMIPWHALEFEIYNEKNESLPVKRLKKIQEQKYLLGEKVGEPLGFSSILSKEIIENSKRLFLIVTVGDFRRKVQLRISNWKAAPFNVELQNSAYLEVGNRYITFDEKRKQFNILKKTNLNLKLLQTRLFRQLSNIERFDSKYIKKLILNATRQKNFNKKNDIVISLYSDRVDRADDNAEVLIQYADSHTISGKTLKNYFILDENSSDYKRLQSLGINVVSFQSEKHLELFLIANYIISSQATDSEWVPFWHNSSLNFALSAGNQPQRIFLQHGITGQKNISTWIRRHEKNLSMFVTTTDEETEIITNPKNGYEYDTTIVKQLGFARHDRLIPPVKKKKTFTILVAPTTRHYLEKYVDCDGSLDSTVSLYEFSFFKNWRAAIKLLRNKLKNYDNVKFKFISHPLLRPFEQLFDLNKDEIIDANERYVDIINSSDMIVSDFSSLVYEFAITNKPVVFFDFEDKAAGQWDKKPKRSEKSTVGHVSTSPSMLSATIEKIILSNFKNEDTYTQRNSELFKYHDRNNSKRIFEEIYTVKKNNISENDLINWETNIKNFKPNYSSENVYIHTYTDESLLDLARKNATAKAIYLKMLTNKYILVSHINRRSRFVKIEKYQPLDSNIQKRGNVLFSIENHKNRYSNDAGNNKLIVVLPGWGNTPTDSPDVLDRTFAPYLNDLFQDVSENTTILRIADFALSHGSFYLNTSIDSTIELGIQSLIKKIRQEYEVEKSNVILVGIQNGGLGAMYHGLVGKYSFIAIAPIIDVFNNDDNVKLSTFQLSFQKTNYMKKIYQELKSESIQSFIIDNSYASLTFQQLNKFNKKIKFCDLKDPLALTPSKIAQLSQKKVLKLVNSF